jgi:ADP-dependent phosphofructokinase/glucokinase
MVLLANTSLDHSHELKYLEDSYMKLVGSFTDRIRDLKALMVLRCSGTLISLLKLIGQDATDDATWDDQLTEVAEHISILEQKIYQAKVKIHSEKMLIASAHVYCIVSLFSLL